MTAIIVDELGRVYAVNRFVVYGNRFEFVYQRTECVGRAWADRPYWKVGKPFVFASRKHAERALAKLRRKYPRHGFAVVAGDALDAPHAGIEALRRVVAKLVAERRARESADRAADQIFNELIALVNSRS